MSYRITYQVDVQWIGPGMGPMSGSTAVRLARAPAGGAQVKSYFNAQGGQNSAAYAAADITALLAAMSADLSTQMNADIATPVGWASGKP